MNQEQWTTVDRYLTDLFVKPDRVLELALADSAAAGLPEISVTAPQGKLLQLLAQMRGARRILELGTLGGYSTIWLGRALPADGRLITLESEQKHAEVARANIAHAGVTERVDLRVGAALDVLPTLQGPFDLIFIDADKPNNPHYLKWALALSRPGTLIVADNVVRHGAVLAPEDGDPNVEGIRTFLQLVADEPRLSATAIQTVGAKGWDGFALAVVGPQATATP